MCTLDIVDTCKKSLRGSHGRGMQGCCGRRERARAESSFMESIPILEISETVG